MSRAALGKRKNPESNLSEFDCKVLQAVKNKKGSGILKEDVRKQTRLAAHLVTKSLQSLITQKLIKKIANGRKPGSELYVGMEFEPSLDAAAEGGLFVDGKLDHDTAVALRKACFMIVRMKKVATAELVHLEITTRRLVTFDVSLQQIGDILESLFLEQRLVAVTSTGQGKYEMFPAGTTCYRIPAADGATQGPIIGDFASIPCGACPRISYCAPGGLISPRTCVYYTKWLTDF